MKLLPVSLVIFYELEVDVLKVWVQTREDDGPFHGLQEFPGGGIEAGESPIDAAVREVAEEVGVEINPAVGKFFGLYTNESPSRTVLLNVFLFPSLPELAGKGQWLSVESEKLSSPYEGIIPGPNHRIIDDLYRAMLS